MTDETIQTAEVVTETTPAPVVEEKAKATRKPKTPKATPKVEDETVQGGEVKAYRKRVVTENGSVIVYL